MNKINYYNCQHITDYSIKQKIKNYCSCKKYKGTQINI